MRIKGQRKIAFTLFECFSGFNVGACIGFIWVVGVSVLQNSSVKSCRIELQILKSNSRWKTAGHIRKTLNTIQFYSHAILKSCKIALLA